MGATLHDFQHHWTGSDYGYRHCHFNTNKRSLATYQEIDAVDDIYESCSKRRRRSSHNGDGLVNGIDYSTTSHNDVLSSVRMGYHDVHHLRERHCQQEAAVETSLDSIGYPFSARRDHASNQLPAESRYGEESSNAIIPLVRGLGKNLQGIWPFSMSIDLSPKWRHHVNVNSDE